MTFSDRKDNQMQMRNAVLLGMFLVLCPISATQAQPESSSAASSPATLGPTDLKVATTSAHLLSSPAAKAQLLQEAAAEDEAFTIVKAGDDLAKSGQWQGAQSQYQQALDVSPKYGSAHRLALYGLIACCQATGDTVGGLAYSRQAIYRGGSTTGGFYENDTKKLMQFALLLNKAGQAAEAVSVYNHAAYALDYQDSQYSGGKPHLKALLPELVAERTLPTQERYTPERLQALAETAVAHEEMAFGSNKEALAHLREAAKFYPDSPVTNYYLGEGLLRTNDPGAKAAYQKAAQLGDDQTIAAANERIKTCR